MLIFTDGDVSRIAFETGFGSISRFYEAFKTVSGRTPRQYRLMHEVPDLVRESLSNPRACLSGGMCK